MTLGPVRGSETLRPPHLPFPTPPHPTLFSSRDPWGLGRRPSRPWAWLCLCHSCRHPCPPTPRALVPAVPLPPEPGCSCPALRCGQLQAPPPHRASPDRPSAGGGGPVTTGAASETDEGARRGLGLVPDASEDWLSLCWRCGSCVWRCGSADLGPGDLRRKQRLGPEPRWGAAPPSCTALPAH